MKKSENIIYRDLKNRRNNGTRTFGQPSLITLTGSHLLSIYFSIACSKSIEQKYSYACIWLIRCLYLSSSSGFILVVVFNRESAKINEISIFWKVSINGNFYSPSFNCRFRWRDEIIDWRSVCRNKWREWVEAKSYLELL